MSGIKECLLFSVVLVTLPALLFAAPPAKTQKCVITGDILSDTTGDGNADVVEVGISVPTWLLLDELGNPAGLELRGDLLDDSEGGQYLAPGYYFGHARVL
jgi:hypothetical protein